MALPANLDALPLQRLQPTSDAQPADWVRHHNRRSYILDAEDRLLSLNLCGCELKDASFLQSTDFQHLQALNLSENQLTELRLPAHLQALRVLNIGENAPLTQLVFEGPLPALETLVADECALESLQMPAGLDALHTLDLRKNKLTQVVFAAGCKKLSFLDLSQNQLKALRLPKGFAALQYLYLNDNLLEEVEFEERAENLEILHLRGNQLAALPEGLVFFSKLKTLYLHGNPLPNVPKGASGVPEGERDNAAPSIRNYLRSITEDQAIPNDEVKLVLLGNSTAGKSSLLRFLRENRFDQSLASTHGIVNELWPDSGLGFKINVWDFGGQEFYHATHRLFLSDNAVSLVVFEQATNKQGKINLHIRLFEGGKSVVRPMPVEVFPFTYWLDNLHYFCRGKQMAMLVQTKMDIADDSIEVKDAERTRYHLPADTPRISVQNTWQGDEKAIDKFKIFKRELFDALRNAIGKYPFSKKWLLIKNDLRALPDSQKMMPYDDYVQFCEDRRQGISQKEPGETASMLDTLTDYLHETGVILWYRDHEDLRKTVFIRPQWVTETIYKVLDYKVMEHGAGKFDHAHVARVAPDMDTKDLLALMLKFELIFPVGNEADTYIAPQYLPEKNPQVPGSLFADLADDCHLPLFTLRFPGFLPRSVMTRFMCKYGPLADGKYWKDGIIFKKDGVWLWVNRSDTFDITVRAAARPPGLGAELLAAFRKISDYNPDLLISPNEADFVRIGDLLDPGPSADPDLRTTHGKWLKVSDFKAVLGGHEGEMPGIFKSDGPTPTPPPTAQPKGRAIPDDPTHGPMTPTPTQTAKPKVFISYAHKDEHFKDEIITHLASLKRQGLIEHWNDRQIASGFWDPQIESAMQGADIFLLLITPNFLASNYISEREITTAYQKFKAGKARIFPVICDFSGGWDLYPVSDETEMHPVHQREMKVWLGKFQPFPKDAKPIKKWKNKNEAYASIVQSLIAEILRKP